jgi:uncharacterized protein (TIGR00251 family)
MDNALRETDVGVVIRVWAIPGASKTALGEYDNWKSSFKFKTKEPAEKDKANRSILDFFETLFGKNVSLISGARSRQKEVLVLGATLKEVVQALQKSGMAKP